jgi:DNA-binding transcriptional LysR family regulator
VAVPKTAGFERRRLLTDDLYVVLPERHPLARRETVSVTDLEGEPLILPRRDTPAGRFRSVVEHLSAPGRASRRTSRTSSTTSRRCRAFVAAGIAVAAMHGLTLATVPAGAVTRPLTERPEGSRAVEALAPAAARTPVVEHLLEVLASAARA